MVQFDDLLPPLSTDEFNALKADIKDNGVLHPVFVDESGNVLDGRHRLKIDPKAPRKVIKGLSEAEKEAFVFRANFVRRNMSPDQKRDALQKMKDTARRLREEDVRKWTQKRIAEVMGVSRQTVTHWFSTNANTGNASKPDSRVKMSSDAKKRAAERVEAGETQSQVAADIGVSQKTISNIVRKAKNDASQARKRVRAIRDARKVYSEDNGILVGDFREIAKKIPDGSVDLIFTDPPWDRKSLDEFYYDLGTIAMSKLVPGGSMMVYTGHAMVDDAIRLIERNGLNFYWTCAEFRPEGPHSRMNRSGFIVTFIPILWFVKGAERYDTSNFVKDSVSSPKPDKKSHAWQQALECATYYIGKLSRKGGLVFDPFCGGGTTSVACKQLGRKWITCDIDENSVVISRKRVSNA